MPELTLKRVDAAILDELKRFPQSDFGDRAAPISDWERAVFIAGVTAAAGLAWQAGVGDPQHPTGHARDAIRAAVARLRKEMRNA